MNDKINNKLFEIDIEYKLKNELYNNVEYYDEFNIDELIDEINDKYYDLEFNDKYKLLIENIDDIIINFLYFKYNIDDLLFIYENDLLINIVNNKTLNHIDLLNIKFEKIIEFINNYYDDKYDYIDENNYNEIVKYEIIENIYDDPIIKFKKNYYNLFEIIDENDEIIDVEIDEIYDIVLIDDVINTYKNIIENEFEFKYLYHYELF